MTYPRLVVVVTGANSGVGFGTCQRLLFELSQKSPPDAKPQVDLVTSQEHENDAPVLPCEALTLILACRSVKRAEAAREQLYKLLDTELTRRKQRGSYDDHADRFRTNLRIEIHYVDMASIQSILHFGEEVGHKYSYVSHLICNAGIASYKGMDPVKACLQITRSPMMAVTSPEYNYQHAGEMSPDGLGWVWQCNVFGHYVLYRTLQPLLSRIPKKDVGPARVLWTTSIEASPYHYAEYPGDWQLLRTSYSYECSKYQIDLIASVLDRRSREDSANGDSVPRIRHVLVQPGVVSTNFANALIGAFLDMLKVVAFYIARALGSPHHTITAYKSAVAGVHMCLVPLSVIPLYISAFSSSSPSETTEKPFSPSVLRPAKNDVTKNPLLPVRFGSETDRWGHEHVGLTVVQQYEKHRTHSSELVDKCEALYQSFLKTGTKGTEA